MCPNIKWVLHCATILKTDWQTWTAWPLVFIVSNNLMPLRLEWPQRLYSESFFHLETLKEFLRYGGQGAVSLQSAAKSAADCRSPTGCSVNEAINKMIWTSFYRCIHITSKCSPIQRYHPSNNQHIVDSDPPKHKQTQVTPDQCDAGWGWRFIVNYITEGLVVSNNTGAVTCLRLKAITRWKSSCCVLVNFKWCMELLAWTDTEASDDADHTADTDVAHEGQVNLQRRRQ